jgi:ATP-binding cassette subfamily C (CFTR/MRP) protein 1
LTIVVLAALQTTLLVIWCLRSGERTRATIASAALSAADAVVFCLLSYNEHALSIRPSALLNVYLFFSIVFDAVRARTLWLINYDTTIQALFTATLSLKVIVLFLEVTEKKRYLGVEDQKLSPEETSGILNQGLFVWLNHLIVTGFKAPLLMKDLYPLNQEFSTSHLKFKFRKNWTLGK